ncbi:MAG: hypothetical protein GW748_05885 [Alphaproteobacteria bacterium]|nr:hypothetical protein [Alphaproteobacteria bacterium]NCQ67256.1 hypothetical protein [Alphaproteobacteria bacterium]NCT07099.1 hypothetical protein [Alphaproteobacteria bacterium]
MIELFRRASGSLIARIFFGFLALSFAFMWGGQDGLRMIGLSKESTVATVGKLSVSNRDLGLAIERMRLNMRLRTGQEISNEDVKKFGIDRQLLDRLIDEALFKIEADRLKISVSDEYVVKMLRNQKAFLLPDGTFSKETFMRFIHNFGFSTEKDYVAHTKAEMIRTRVIAALSANASLPFVATAPLYSWNAQIRTAQGMVIDPTKMELKEAPTEDQLRDFYGKNRRQFYAPERRTFKAVIMNVANLKIPVKEEDIQVIYDLEKDRKYKDVPEKEAKERIRGQLRHDGAQEVSISMADKIQTQFEGGTALAEVAKNNGATFKEFKDVPLTSKNEKRSDLDQAIIDLAFNAVEGELSPMEELNESGQYFVVYLEAHKDPEQLSFGEAMEDIRFAYKREAQTLMTKELVEKIQKQLGDGGNFKSVAAQHKLALTTVRASRQQALAPTAVDLPPVAINQLFSVPRGHLTLVPYQGKEGQPLFLIAKVTDVKNGDASKRTEEVKKFEDLLQQQAGSDVVELYVSYLRQKNPVEINKAYFPE